MHAVGQKQRQLELRCCRKCSRMIPQPPNKGTLQEQFQNNASFTKILRTPAQFALSVVSDLF